jgi:geranylgeranyl pyrophosphate synthase
MEPGDVERAQQVLIDCGARDEIETTIGRLVEDATAAIQEAPLLPEIREVLVGAAHLIANRDH